MPTQATPQAEGPRAAPDRVPITLTVNGRQLPSWSPGRRCSTRCASDLGLTGTKKGCDHGQCGACTVLVDGRRINSCLTLAVMKDGARSRRSRASPQDGALHPMQAGVHRARRLPVRLLHAGPDLLGGRR